MKLKDVRTKISINGPAVFLIVLFIFFSIFANNFTRPGNLNNILRQSAMLSLLALGHCFVVLLGGIDLSQGSVLGLTAVITAMLLAAGVPLVFGLLIGLGIAFLLGLFSGYLIAYVKVPVFVSTFGMSGMALGIGLVITNSSVVWGFPPTVRLLHDYELFNTLSILFVIVGFMYLLAYYVLKYTKFGTSVFAIGGNKLASDLSGISVRRNTMLVYAISSAMAGFGGIIMLARMNSARAVMGSGYEFESFAAVILGGTNRLGGKGGAVRTLIGVLIIGVMRNGLNLMGVSVYLQLVTLGSILVIVYILNENSAAVLKAVKSFFQKRRLKHA